MARESEQLDGCGMAGPGGGTREEPGQPPPPHTTSEQSTRLGLPIEEALSWRRTAVKAATARPAPHCLPVLLLLLLLVVALLPPNVSASEFPQRECCDNPVYRPEPGQTTRYPPLYNQFPGDLHEVPDWPEYGPAPPPRRLPPDTGELHPPNNFLLLCGLSQKIQQQSCIGTVNNIMGVAVVRAVMMNNKN